MGTPSQPPPLSLIDSEAAGSSSNSWVKHVATSVQMPVSIAIAQLAALERQQGLAENSLSVLLGHPPGPIERSGIGVADTLDIPEIPVGLPSELLLRRPDVRQSEQDLAAQTAQIAVAVADGLPGPLQSGTGRFPGQ